MKQPVTKSLSSATLSRRLKANPVEPEQLNIRLHRAISWLRCAEANVSNPDLQYISLWIAFNACYAIDGEGDETLNEKQRFRGFVEKLVQRDSERRIFNILWERFSGPIRNLVENPYVFKPFWDFQRKQIAGWKGLFNQSVADANKNLSKGDVPAFLGIVLDRLYVLRNQVMHGGSTYNSKINRQSLKDGCRILDFLVPVIIDIMMQNPSEDWGEIYFPVIRD